MESNILDKKFEKLKLDIIDLEEFLKRRVNSNLGFIAISEIDFKRLTKLQIIRRILFEL